MNEKTVPDQEHAERIADVRAFADWLEQNPWVPTPSHLDAAEHLNGHGQRAEEQWANLVTLEQVASRLGAKVNKSLHDRTSMNASVGKFSYRLVVWHENGRPSQVDDQAAELERLRARVAELEKAAAPVLTLTAVGDIIGLTYSREADDPTPVSPARGGEVHVGAVTGDGLVDETEPQCTPECDAITVPGTPGGPTRPWHHDDCPATMPPEAREQDRHAESVSEAR